MIATAGDVFPKLCCDVVNRGVAVYKNKVYLATLDAHIVALDNASGKVVWDKKIGDYTYAETFTIMPMALQNKIIFGTAGAEYGVRGWIAAIDADTGAPVWKTYTIPGPGEPGNDTWPGESWKYGGGSAGSPVRTTRKPTSCTGPWAIPVRTSTVTFALATTCSPTAIW
jgi:alcohol dehydrogenase (cytochrome c)